MTGWFLSTCALIAALMLLRRALRGRMDPRLTYALWLLCALRILIPVNLFQSPASVGALAQRSGVEQAVERVRRAVSPKRVMIVDAPADSVSLEEYAESLNDGGLHVYDAHLSTPEELEQLREQYPDNIKDGEQPVSVVTEVTVGGRSFWGWVYRTGVCAVGLLLVVLNVRFSLALKRRRRSFRGELPVPCPLEVYIVKDLPSPCLAGLLRPAVYLNRAAVENGRLDHILTHELTHYRHGDQWWAWLRCVCLAAQWFNPLVWAAAYLSRQDCELACDASAIKSLGEGERLPYGRTLVDMIAAARSPSALFQTATTMSGGKRGIRERLALIVRRPRMTALTVSAVLLIAALAVGCTFGGAGESGGEADPPPENTAPSSQPSDHVQPSGNVQPADSARYFFSDGIFLGSWDAGTWHSAAAGGFTLGELFNREYFNLFGESRGAVRFFAAAGPGGFDDPAEVQRLLRPYGVMEGDNFIMQLPGQLSGQAAQLAVPDYGFSAIFDGQAFSCISNVALTLPDLIEGAVEQDPAGQLPLLGQAGVKGDPERMACITWGYDVDGDGAMEELTLVRNVVDEGGYLVLEEGDSIFYALLLTDDGETTLVTVQTRDYTDDVTAHFTPGQPVPVDLDGDGMCEIILRHGEWEWGHISAFSLVDGQWTEVLRAEYGM